MSRETILEEINYERTYQQGKYGDTHDDTAMMPDNWVADIAQYSSRWRPGKLGPHPAIVVDDFRTSMLKVAALAVAAIESLDRQRAEDGNAFYERPTVGHGLWGRLTPEQQAAFVAPDGVDDTLGHVPIHKIGECPMCNVAGQERAHAKAVTESLPRIFFSAQEWEEAGSPSNSVNPYGVNYPITTIEEEIPI